MKYNKKCVPIVRFDGFFDEWIRCKFKDHFIFPVSTNSLSRAMLNYEKGEIKNIHYGDILINYPSILNVKKEVIPYITNGYLKDYSSDLLKNGDLIFTDTAKDRSVGKAIEINGITNENIVSGLHTIVARCTKQKAQYFLGYYINSEIYHRQLSRVAQRPTIFSINKSDVQKTNISFPKDTKEQQKIGMFFKNLDNNIYFYKQKINKLTKLKSAYLQNIFI